MLVSSVMVKSYIYKTKLNIKYIKVLIHITIILKIFDERYNIIIFCGGEKFDLVSST